LLEYVMRRLTGDRVALQGGGGGMSTDDRDEGNNGIQASAIFQE
jgi:hypothetical protein